MISFYTNVRCSPFRVYLADPTIDTAAQHQPWRSAGVACVFDHHSSVHDDSRACAARIPVGIGVSCLVAEIVWVKDCEIGAVTYFQQPTVTQFEGFRGSAGHLVYCLFERNQPLVTDVACDKPWKCAVKARMRQSLAVGPVGRNTVPIRADQRSR